MVGLTTDWHAPVPLGSSSLEHVQAPGSAVNLRRPDLRRPDFVDGAVRFAEFDATFLVDTATPRKMPGIPDASTDSRLIPGPA
jgi:hypothetical protein